MLLPVIAFWLLMLAVVTPFGNFPLNDDWIYSTAVSRFLETGGIHLPWVTPSCNVHVVLGGLVCSLMGFSHEVLRLLTVILYLASAITIFYIARELKLKERTAVFASLCYAVNPILVNLSFSYMTDIPALLFSNLFVLFFVKWLKSGTNRSLMAGSIFILLAIGVRQTNIVFIIPTLVLILIARFKNGRKALFPIAALVILPVIWTVLMEKIMLSGTTNVDAFNWYKDEIRLLLHSVLTLSLRTWKELIVGTGRGIIYDAFLILPLIVISLPVFIKLLSGRKPATVSCAFFSAIFTGLTAYSLIKKKGPMPFSPNIMSLPELGPQSILPVIPNPASPLYYVLTALCIVLAFLLAWGLLEFLFREYILLKRNWRQEESSGRDLATLFVTLSFLITFAVSVMQTLIHNLDRYYVFAIPGLILCVALFLDMVKTNRIWWLGVTALVVLGSYSVIAEQDYMSLNRARWGILQTLEGEGVKPGNIDGGSEYNFYRNPDLTKYVVLKPNQFYFSHTGPEPQCHYRWWPVESVNYIVATEPVDGYEIVKKKPYFSLLFLQTKYIYLNKKKS